MATEGFAYPKTKHVRRHGPAGYADYESYRDWLRDEFSFRCLFCLNREQWGKGRYGYHLDHWLPVTLAPHLRLDYDNLVYACSHCNQIRPEDERPVRPEDVAYGDCLEVEEDGSIRALSEQGELIRDYLRLDNVENTSFRRRWIQILRLARETDPELYSLLLAYPEDLPDLRRKNPPRNTRPHGIRDCCFAKRDRDGLPSLY